MRSAANGYFISTVQVAHTLRGSSSRGNQCKGMSCPPTLPGHPPLQHHLHAARRGKLLHGVSRGIHDLQTSVETRGIQFARMYRADHSNPCFGLQLREETAFNCR